jgi:O-antigen/teichoic acid export membrane protein
MDRLVELIGGNLYLGHLVTQEMDAQAVADNIKGIYDQANTLFNMPCAFIIPITVSVIPAITSNLTLKNHEAVRETEESAARITGLLSLPCSVGLALLAKPIIRILYGTEYATAANALRIVVWYTTFSYMGAVRNIWILANEKQKYLWIINLSGALMNVALNAVLIPAWGIQGAAVASLVTQFFTNFVLGFILKPIRENNKIVLAAFNVKNYIHLLKK